MYKRYLIVIALLIALIGFFFLFFDKPSNKEVYNEYLAKIEKIDSYNDLNKNDDLNISVESDYLNNQYLIKEGSYYPSFGIIDSKNINLVNDNNDDNETKGVNLVVSNKEKIETFKIYVSYNNREYYYLLNVGES